LINWQYHQHLRRTTRAHNTCKPPRTRNSPHPA
jgi:hypothetical protein